MSGTIKTEGNASASVGRERRPTPAPLSGRSRKRAVSTGGRSASRLVYAQSLVPHEANLKSFSLGFNFNPPTPGTVSFTSTGSGKWWKSKFGIKKLVNSVRRKKKKISKNECSPRALLEKSELDLKKRRLDFEKEFRNKALHTRPIEPTTFVKMESVPLTPPVLQGTNASVKEKAKTNSTMTSSLADATASRMGPGGETLKQQPGSPCSNNDTEKDASFRTPSESNSELNTESDVSFVMCESTDELSTSLKKCKIDDKSPSDSAPTTNSSPADNKTVQKGAKCPETIVLPSSQETAEVTTELSKSSDTTTIHAVKNDKAETVGQETPANKVNNCHCPCACLSRAGIIRENSWLPYLVLVVAMIAGIYFQYYFLFPLLKD